MTTRNASAATSGTLINHTFLREAPSTAERQEDDPTQKGEHLLGMLGAAAAGADAGRGGGDLTLLEALHAHWSAGDHILSAAQR
eukprot:scaffold343095_cov35-Prasinocladus_malaysianus.AAC.1